MSSVKENGRLSIRRDERVSSTPSRSRSVSPAPFFLSHDTFIRNQANKDPGNTVLPEREHWQSETNDQSIKTWSNKSNPVLIVESPSQIAVKEKTVNKTNIDNVNVIILVGEEDEAISVHDKPHSQTSDEVVESPQNNTLQKKSVENLTTDLELLKQGKKLTDKEIIVMKEKSRSRSSFGQDILSPEGENKDEFLFNKTGLNEAVKSERIDEKRMIKVSTSLDKMESKQSAQNMLEDKEQTGIKIDMQNNEDDEQEHYKKGTCRKEQHFVQITFDHVENIADLTLDNVREQILEKGNSKSGLIDARKESKNNLHNPKANTNNVSTNDGKEADVKLRVQESINIFPCHTLEGNKRKENLMMDPGNSGP